MHDRAVPVQVEDVLAQPSRDAAQIHLGFDDHATAHDVEPAGESQ
jgi:hypothetical protein